MRCQTTLAVLTYLRFAGTHSRMVERALFLVEVPGAGADLAAEQVIEAHTKTNTEMPVNLKMIFEGMEESGSNGLEEVVIAESKEFLADVDAVCISDNYWLVRALPSLGRECC